jgi:hypothetical protein
MLDITTLGHLAIDDPVLYDWLGAIAGAFNRLQQQVGIDAQGPASLPTPNPPGSVRVTSSLGTFNIALGASPGAAPGVQYFLEVSTDPNFSAAATTVYPLGSTLSLSLTLGNVVRYFRARCKYPSSSFSNYVYAGTAANPTAASGGHVVAAWQELADASVIDWDASHGSGQVTLAGNRQIANPTNLTPGMFYALMLVQDTTGGRTVTFDTNFRFPAGSPDSLSTAPATADVFTFVTDGTLLYRLAFAPALA